MLCQTHPTPSRRPESTQPHRWRAAGWLPAGAVLGLALVLLPGCGGQTASLGSASPQPSLLLQLERGDSARGADTEIPRWIERRWSGSDLLAEAGDEQPARRLRVSVLDPDGTLHEGEIRVPRGAFDQPASGDGPLPVARLRRPAVTLSLVGVAGSEALGHGIVQARMDGAFLASLDKLDSAATLDQGLWLALLGLDADGLEHYRAFAGPVDADGAIALREAGIDPSVLAELAAGGATFTSAELLELQAAGVSPAVALRLREEGVAPRVDAMMIAASADGQAARRSASAAGARASLAPTPADAVAPASTRFRLPPATPGSTRARATTAASRRTPAPTAANATPSAPVIARGSGSTPPPAATLAAATGPTPAAATTPAAARTPTTTASTAPTPANAAIFAKAEIDEQPTGFTPGSTADVDGVPGAYADLMTQLGYTREADLKKLFVARVEPRAVRDFLDAGHNPTVQELLDARSAGIDGSDALEMARAGYRFPLADILDMARAGVTPAYAVALVDPRFPTLTAEQLVDLKGRGVTPEQVREIRNR